MRSTPRPGWLRLIAMSAPAACCIAQGNRDAEVLRRLRATAVVERDVMVPMRDGVRLATDIVRPKRPGQYPVVLARTPYQKRLRPNVGLIRQGYALAVQDVRGRYGSEGEFTPFLNDPHDGYDTVEWLAKQSWCDGKVGMQGGSYVGFTQLAAALTRPPHLRCIAPSVPPADFDNGTLFLGGAMRKELAQGWLLGQSWRSQRVRRGQVPPDELKRWTPFKSFSK